MFVLIKVIRHKNKKISNYYLIKFGGITEKLLESNAEKHRKQKLNSFFKQQNCAK